ncbi:MAG: hypothetical protein WDO73_01745 [Ignavibacteriota bacterium]
MMTNFPPARCGRMQGQRTNGSDAESAHGDHDDRQLSVRLQRRKRAVDAFVVDHTEKVPTENQCCVVPLKVMFG